MDAPIAPPCQRAAAAASEPESVLFEPLRLIAPARNLVIEFFCAEPLVFLMRIYAPQVEIDVRCRESCESVRRESRAAGEPKHSVTQSEMRRAELATSFTFSASFYSPSWQLPSSPWPSWQSPSLLLPSSLRPSSLSPELSLLRFRRCQKISLIVGRRSDR